MLFVKTVPRALSRLGLDQRGDAPFLRPPAPMRLQKADALFPSADWAYEPKVRRSMVVEAECRQRLKDGLRHAALKGLRLEKKPGLMRRSPMRERGPF